MAIKKQYVKYDRIHPVIDPASGRTHQSFKEECDINNLVEHWMKTGVAQFTYRQPHFIDVSDVLEYQELANLRAFAKSQYEMLSEEDQKAYGSPMAFMEALLEEDADLGTDDSLDVTVPSDSDSRSVPQSGQKGGIRDGKKVSKQAPQKEEQTSLLEDGDEEA